MDTDLLLVLGVLCAVLSFPAVVGAMSRLHPPSRAISMLLLSGGLIGYAVYENPGAYSLETLPDVVSRVIVDLMT